jgi:transposase
VNEAVNDLPDDVGALKAMIIAERLRSARLQHLLDVLNRMHFGKRSEKMTPDQLLLTFEDTDIAMGEVDLIQEQSTEALEPMGGARSRKRTADASRPSLPSHLPRHEIEIAPEMTCCAGCGGTLHRIGEDRAERLDIVPAQYRVLVTVRPKMACRGCGDGVAQAPALKHIVPGGLPSEALVADVLVKKYADHLPLYRQAQIMGRQGVAIDRATLANWVGRAAGYLKPLVELQKHELLKSARLFVDETTAKVLAPGTGKTRTGYLWAMVRDDRAHGGADPPAIVYTYMPGRGAMWANKLLGDYRGIMQVDAYPGYGQFGKANRPGGPSVLAYCWAHARRGFYDAAKGDGATIAREALRRIGMLYEIERDIQGRSPDERLAARQARSRPVVEDLRAWLDEKRRRMFSGSPTLGPINYALNQWSGLVAFLDDGRIDIDNNPVERSMRPIALQRKNALFAGHELGAENWAAIASLVESCKLNGINPNAYLADVLARIVLRADGDPLDDLLLGNWVDTRAAETTFETSDMAQAA